MAFIEKAPIITADLANDSEMGRIGLAGKMTTHGYAGCWTTPIMTGSGEASGIIAIHRREPANPTTQEQDLD